MLVENYTYSHLQQDEFGNLKQNVVLDQQQKKQSTFLASKIPQLYSCQAFDTQPVNENIKQAIESMIRQDPCQDAFLIYDSSRLESIFNEWKQTIPWIQMRYAVKCNPLKCLLSDLYNKGSGFDIASQGELEKLAELKVPADRIIYSNPFKAETALDYAYKYGVRLTVADTYGEMEKIKRLAPEMKILWRIAVPSAKKSSGCVNFGDKFGDPMTSINEIQIKFQELYSKGYMIAGIHFHAGSGHDGSEGFQDWLQVARQCILIGKQIGHPMEILDIGGGFAANSINQSISSVLQYNEKDVLGCQYIAEPGRHIASRLFQLACRVIGKRQVGNKVCIYINDGVYHAFNKVATDHVSLDGQKLFFTNNNNNGSKSHYQSLQQKINSSLDNKGLFEKQQFENEYFNESEEEISATIFGMTCDGLDVIAKDVIIPKSIDIGDWLVFGGMGAYTYSMVSYFNSMSSCSKVLVVENSISTVPIQVLEQQQQSEQIQQLNLINNIGALVDNQVLANFNSGAGIMQDFQMPIDQEFEQLNLSENSMNMISGAVQNMQNENALFPDIVQAL